MKQAEAIRGKFPGELSLHSIKPLQPLAREPEILAYLQVSKRTLATYRQQRLIPFVRLGKAFRYDRAAVQAAIHGLTVLPRR